MSGASEELVRELRTTAAMIRKCGASSMEADFLDTTTDALTAAQATIARLEAELAGAREALRAANEPCWFYYGDDCSSERCRGSIYECIDEDFEYENDEPKGDHVLLISGARPVPDIWVALHYYTEAEKDARDSDDEYTFTEHNSKEDAEAALRRGIEIGQAERPELTRDMVREAYLAAQNCIAPNERFIDRLHAALQERLK